MIATFTIFFHKIAHLQGSGGLPYHLFVCAGILPWTFFSAAITQCGNSVVSSEQLITKIYFPRLCIPLASVAAGLVDFAVATSLMIVLMLRESIVPGFGILLAPCILGLIVLAALGIGTIFAALNVAYRDFRYVIPFVVQLWLFATPTIYMDLSQTGANSSATNVPAAEGQAGQNDFRMGENNSGSPRSSLLQALFTLNPMTGLIAGFRASLLGGPVPWAQLALPSVVVVFLFFGGCLYFRKVEDTFPDII
jgi:lipopolysaccharide transport system permease protein